MGARVLNFAQPWMSASGKGPEGGWTSGMRRKAAPYCRVFACGSFDGSPATLHPRKGGHDGEAIAADG